jgi:hypothetical protein
VYQHFPLDDGLSPSEFMMKVVGKIDNVPNFTA